MSPAGWTWLPYPASKNIKLGAYLNLSALFRSISRIVYSDTFSGIAQHDMRRHKEGIDKFA
jgi:hypothetical protein